ncbi:MAG TPA: helix-turn-helix domain-containing protein [Propionibacteriaceae bacterium]|nr:helix-turn-helix domain-containing protein [Propionibacteriaceae bacterium]
MSIKVTAWVLETVKLPGDPIAKLVLIGLADHANADGTAAWPPQATLAGYADVSVRTVRTKIRELERLGLIHSGDQELVSHLPANRRPHVWDIDLEWQPGRNAASGQKDLPGGNELPPKTPAWAEARRISGRKAVSDKPSLEPSLKELPTNSLRSLVGATRGTRLDPDWMPSPELIEQMRQECPTIDLQAEHLKFVDYWCAKTGKDATKIDWTRTWRNWIRNAKPVNGNGFNRYALRRQEESDQHWTNLMSFAREEDQRRGLNQDTPKEITQ